MKNKFLLASLGFLACTLAYAGVMSQPPAIPATTTVTDTLAVPKAEPVAFEASPVYIFADAPAPKKPVTKKRACVVYPMYGGKTETVRICG